MCFYKVCVIIKVFFSHRMRNQNNLAFKIDYSKCLVKDIPHPVQSKGKKDLQACLYVKEIDFLHWKSMQESNDPFSQRKRFELFH